MATLKIGTYKIHPICAEVPDPTDEEYAAMAESMKARGIQKPILIWGAEVVSGKTRVRIGVEFGLKIPELKWHPKSAGKDAVEREIRTLLMDEDYNRRHLTTGQRAMFAAPLVTTNSPGRPSKEIVENSTISETDAANSAGVSRDSIRQASVVIESGATALKDAVRGGEVTVSDAAKVAGLPKSEQTAAVKAVKSGESKTVAAAAGVSKKSKPREPGDESEHQARQSKSRTQAGVNGKLDFDDNLIEGLFGKLIKAIDQRADVFKQKNSAYHKTCINRLDGFITAFNEWKATRR